MEITRTLPLLLLVSLGGCGESSSVPSGSLTNNNIYPNITVVENQNGEVVTTAVLENSVYLSDGDKFYASLGTPPDQLINFSDDLFATAQTMSTRLKVMEKRTLSEYFATDTSAGLAAPVRAYVAFERGSGQWTGQTWVDLPPAFTIINPASYSSLSRVNQNPIALTWADSDNTAMMELDSQAVCNGVRYSAPTISLGPDTGSASVDAVDYFYAAGVLDVTATCQVGFTLRRLGPPRGISEELGLGSLNTIQGTQLRVVEFTSTP